MKFARSARVDKARSKGMKNPFHFTDVVGKLIRQTSHECWDFVAGRVVRSEFKVVQIFHPVMLEVE